MLTSGRVRVSRAVVIALVASACGRIGFDAGFDAPAGTDATSVGLIHHWKLDETGGLNAPDASGTANGVLMGDATWLPTDGQIGGALEFNGNGSIVAIGRPASLTNLASLTVSAWIKANVLIADGEPHCVVDKGLLPDGGWAFRTSRNNDGDLGFGAYYGPLEEVSRTSPGGALVIADWTHVVATWDGSGASAGIHVYINGTETSYAESVDTAVARPDDAAIDAFLNCNATPNFDGLLDDIKIYNRVLTPAEVAAL